MGGVAIFHSHFGAPQAPIRMACFELQKAQAQSLTQTLKLPLIGGGLKPPIYGTFRTSQISHLHGKWLFSTLICTTPWPMLEVLNDSPLGPPAQ